MSNDNNSSLVDILIKGFKVFFDFGFIFFPSIGFIAQYFKIKKIKNSQGFSKFISFSLIMAFIFRIYFWLGKKFEVTLLYQSIVGIFIQLMLLHICVRYNQKTHEMNKLSISENYKNNDESEIKVKSSQNLEKENKINNYENRTSGIGEIDNIYNAVNLNSYKNVNICNFNNSPIDGINSINNINILNCINEGTNRNDGKDLIENYYLKFFSLQNFWNWNLFYDYLNFLFFFIIIVGIFTHIFEENRNIYFEILGSMSAFSEGIIAVPQIIANFRHKSTKTLSNILVLTWICGDSIKSIYFLFTDTPLQLVLCSVSQLTLDCIIILQIFYYKYKVNPII